MQVLKSRKSLGWYIYGETEEDWGVAQLVKLQPRWLEALRRERERERQRQRERQRSSQDAGSNANCYNLCGKPYIL
jgi:hypothetical protein